MFNERLNPKVDVQALMSACPFVSISNLALSKMFQYVDLCSDEIGWLGVAKREGKKITIEDVYLFEQDVHSTTTEITADGLSSFAEELFKMPNGMDIWNDIRLWGHSHVNMGVSPSGQDNTQMITFSEGGHPWFLRVIANKKGEMEFTLFEYDKGLVWHNIPWQQEKDTETKEIEEAINTLLVRLESLQNGIKDSLKQPIEDEIKLKVKKKTYAMSGSFPKNSYFGGKGSNLQSNYNQNSYYTYDNNKKVYREINVKKKEEERKETKNESNTNHKHMKTIDEDGWFDDNTIFTDLESYFDKMELYDIGECAFFREASPMIDEYAQYMDFTDCDKQIIWDLCLKAYEDVIYGKNYEA